MPDPLATLTQDPAFSSRFELGPPLGTGAGGVVRAAVDLLLGREVALKPLPHRSALERQRARREVAALMLLDLPGVARLLDQVTVGEQVMLVMERATGAPFPGTSSRRWEEVETPTAALLAILSGVHAAGLVHRDLKPENALVGPDGRVTLLDFGLATGAEVGPRVTQPGGLVGTPRYAAPEQLAGDALDGRADLYALGAMLYEQLAGDRRTPRSGWRICGCRA